MEVRRDHCVIGLKPSDGEYASADTDAAKVAAVEEFVQKYVENIGVRPSKANTAWVEKKLGIDLANDVRVRLRKVGYRRDEIHLPLRPSTIRNAKTRPAFETAHYSRCAKVEALNELCGKHLVNHETVAQRGSPVLPSRAANDWRPLVFDPVEKRRYQPKSTTAAAAQCPAPSAENSNATETLAYGCSGALRAAEGKLDSLALHSSKRERARNTSKQARVIEAVQFSCGDSEDMRANQDLGGSIPGYGDLEEAHCEQSEQVLVTAEPGSIPVPDVVFQHRRRIHALANRKYQSVLGGTLSANSNRDQNAGSELSGIMSAIPETPESDPEAV